MPDCKILTGDCREVLKTLPDASVQMCVTSPPYWGLRDYGTATWDGGDPECEHKPNVRNGSGRADGVVDERGQRNRDGVAGMEKARSCACGAARIDRQIGQEKTPQEFVETMVQVFREVRRVLKDDGVLWLNLGDSYATGAGSARSPGGKCFGKQNKVIDEGAFPMSQPNRMPIHGLKPKDLVGIPWMTAFALRADGWYLRQDIIWNKPNPMPESVTDRCTKAHEYIFLLSKSERYYYDHKAINEPIAEVTRNDRVDTGRFRPDRGYPGSASAGCGRLGDSDYRNKRSVWTVTTSPYPEAHFATYPPDLIKPCILAGSRVGDTIVDPFGGSGTTGAVALELGRSAILIELNESYADLAHRRTDVTPGLALT
jgi:DNA modification methylase